MRSRHLALLTMGAIVPAVVVAGTEPRPFRTRAADDNAWQLLSTGLSASPTVRRLVAALEKTDVIVTVEVSLVLPPAMGDIRILSAAAGARHLRIRVTTCVATPDRLAVFGHELQHAVEIASVPEVRDAETLERLFERIGFRHWKRAVGGGWETLAAIEAGDCVASEVRTAKPR